jgi:uncharacterized SAM-binding protein YcdF (DUF218 family)
MGLVLLLANAAGPEIPSGFSWVRWLVRALILLMVVLMLAFIFLEQWAFRRRRQARDEKTTS